MVIKEKLHSGPQSQISTPLSRNNHAHLKDKSSAAQGLSVAIPASSESPNCDRRDRIRSKSVDVNL
jgi:hypothetical protein